MYTCWPGPVAVPASEQKSHSGGSRQPLAIASRRGDSSFDLASGPSFYVAGDTILASIETLEARWSNNNPCCVGSFDARARFELLLPPTAGFAAYGLGSSREWS